ncbi:MAG: squalene/phytoene synthase family protein [Persicimonas sp.]
MTPSRPSDDTLQPPPLPDDIEAVSEWPFCWQSLVQVSRTFSRPIELLPPRLRVATTCGYLHCRIADTVEDDPQLDLDERIHLYETFLAVLEQGDDASAFNEAARALSQNGAEVRLATNLDRVMVVYEQLPRAMRQTCTRWIGEMVRGMSLYGHRKASGEGVTTLNTVADLERYCYFVAGTVGQMLTGLFEAAAEDLDPERLRTMRRRAESFGLGLQMVNILKDQTDDLERGWSFIPRTVWDEVGCAPHELDDPRAKARAHKALEPIFERARRHLDDALAYTLAIPPGEIGMRLFCLLPLWMAVRTLVHAHRNDAMFTPGEPVKITREEVERLIADATQNVADDRALQTTYDKLWAD